MSTNYPALVYFYDAQYHDMPIRIAALWQPVSEQGVNGMALILVAETLTSRHAFAAGLLRTAAYSQGALVLMTLLLVSLMLRRVLRPLRRLSRTMLLRDPADLSPLPPMMPWTEMQPLMSAFNRYLTRLRDLLARQERFSADVSHQLRTPLTILKTQVSLALNSSRTEIWQESLQGMRSTLDDTISLTDRLLKLSRVKSRYGDQQALQPVDLAALVCESCLTRYAQARSKHIDLGYEGDEHCQVMGDPLLLAELCANLLDNAIKYTPVGGVVTARLQQGCLEIEDSGPGIAESERQLAMMPFRRLDASREQSGDGLGLALVKDISAWHHTHAELSRSSLLGGLRVQIKFPACQ